MEKWEANKWLIRRRRGPSLYWKGLSSAKRAAIASAQGDSKEVRGSPPPWSL